MAAEDEAVSQLAAAFKAWDFYPAFGPGYSGAKAVLITDQYPFDVIDNMLQESGTGYMTRPIISIRAAPSRLESRTLGETFGPGAGSTTRFGRRLWITFLVTAWADQTMGGNSTVESLAGQVQGCCFYNAFRLQAVKGLWAETSGNAFEERPQMWRYDLAVRSYAVVSYDA